MRHPRSEDAPSTAWRGAAAVSRLDVVRQPAEAGAAKQAAEAAQSRQAEQPLTSGDEAQAPQKAEESEKAVATVSRPLNEFSGQRRLVFRTHLRSPAPVWEGSTPYQCAKRENVTGRP